MAPNPYIILTEEALIISAIARDKTTSIKWRDIRAFRVREYDFRMNIEIELVDKEANFPKTLHVSKHPNSFAGTSRYGIAWGMIKRKDRLRFVDEMDCRAKCFYTLKEQLFPATDENKTKPSERVTGKYLQKAFLYSLILSAFTALLFSAPQSGSMNIVNLISSFILFPFAKVLYDVIGGFKLGDKLERQRGYINRLIYGLIFIFHLLLYFFSIYIGPLGILYLVIRVMYKNRKNNQK